MILNYKDYIKEIFNYPKITKYTNDDIIKNDIERYDRYYQRLNLEYEQIYNHSDFQKIWRLIEKDCKPFLDEIKRTGSDLIFRGVNQLDSNVAYGMDKRRSRRDRQPKDMNPVIQKEFDEKFLDKFGIKLRSEGTFTTKDPLQAEAYSRYSQSRKRKEKFLFFPIGDYKYFWNPEVDDLFTKIEDQQWYYKRSFNPDYTFADIDCEKDEWNSKWGDPEEKLNAWTSLGGGKGKRINNEWIPDLSFEEYLEQQKKKLLSECDENISKFVNGYKNTNIEDVKHQEITFICDEYYLVDDVFLHKIIKKIKK
jgi:hypothetical protein